LGPWVLDGEWRHTEGRIGPEDCIEGTDRPSTGVLFAYLDVVTGSPPSGIMNPTVDLQVRLLSRPRSGTIRFTARTLRLGRSLYVGEAEMRHSDGGTPFGIALATFINQPIPFPERHDPERDGPEGPEGARTSFYRFSGARRVGPGMFELIADIHTPQGTVGGATLGRLAEMTAVDLMRGAGAGVVAVDELDVRFLHKVRRGPLVSTGTVLGERAGATTVRVEVTDSGDDDRLVTYALAVCRSVRPS
jgi:acyl-coenzyme A thioesterase PaaI-like protein